MLAALNLDGAQQAEMDTIDEEEEEEEALLDEAYQKAAENMESLKLLEKEMILESRSVLTAEQITELRKMMQERMESRQGP